MTMEQPGADKRKFSRIPFKRTVKYRLDINQEPIAESSQDLGLGGLRIRSNEFIPVGQILEVGVQLVDSGEVVRLPARVKWVRYNPYSESYQLGLEFEQGELYPLSRISRFLSNP